MRNICTVMGREIRSNFTGPIGYIYLIGFLLLTNILGLFSPVNPFFYFPVADMRTYFHILAGVSAIFVAVVTMRMWAEERKENTFEMLLTFPMKPHELVLGKFLAALLFYVVSLVLTLTVPIMMIAVSGGDGEGAIEATRSFWGLLDIGPVLTGYLGAILLGAFFVSFGLFISGFCRDQIVAFVLTAPLLFFAYILGLPVVRTLLDSGLAPLGQNLGTWVGEFIGIFSHFDNLTRGLVTGGDLLFFLTWIVVFLILNGIGIERRGRKGGNLMLGANTALLLGIGIAVNWLVMDQNLGKVDVTEDQIYTVSPASVEVLGSLEDDVILKYYVSRRDKLPRELQTMERDVRDKLRTLSEASNGRLRYKVIGGLEAANVLSDPMEAQNGEEDESKEESIEKRLLKKIKPFQVQVPREDEFTTQLIYSAIEIAYKEKESQIIPQVVPQVMPKLEYLIVNKVFRLTRESDPVVAMVAPTEEINIPPQMAAIYRQMGREIPKSDDPYKTLQQLLESENYEVRRVALTQREPLPDAYDVLVIVNPQDLNERQQWEISHALARGKPAFFAVQKYTWDYKTHRTGRSASREDENPGINPVLAPSGVTLDSEVLMDQNKVPLNMGAGGMLGMAQPWDLPMQIMVKSGDLNPENPITGRLGGLFYLWGSALNLERETLGTKGIGVTTLAQSSNRSWTRATGQHLKQADIQPPRAASRLYPRPLAVLLEGAFAYAFEGKERPAWPEEPPPQPGQPPKPPAQDKPDPGPPTLAPGKLILIGSAMPLRKEFLQSGDAVNFFMNCVDYLALGDMGMKILSLRDKTATNRTLGKLSSTSSTVWKLVHFPLIHLAVALAGVAIWLLRKRRRDAYNAQYK